MKRKKVEQLLVEKASNDGARWIVSDLKGLSVGRYFLTKKDIVDRYNLTGEYI